MIYDAGLFLQILLIFVPVWGVLFLLDIAIAVFKHFAERG